MATSKKQSENGSKAASVSRTVKKPATKTSTRKSAKKPAAKVAKKPTTKKTATKTSTRKSTKKTATKTSTRKSTAKSAKPTTKKTTTKKVAKKPVAKKSTRKSVKKSPNPHAVKPERYNNYPARGPVTLTYRNPRARRDQQLTLWVHVDQAIHWMERGLWHHLTPMQEGCQVLHIGVGGRFIS